MRMLLMKKVGMLQKERGTGTRVPFDTIKRPGPFGCFLRHASNPRQHRVLFFNHRHHILMLTRVFFCPFSYGDSALVANNDYMPFAVPRVRLPPPGSWLSSQWRRDWICHMGRWCRLQATHTRACQSLQ